MAQGSRIPPYGNWGSEQHVETKFEKGPEVIRSWHVRGVSRDGGELRKLTDSPARADSSRSVGNKSESERLSRDESDSRRSSDSPLRPVNVGLRGTTDSPLHRQSGSHNTDSPKRATRHGLVSDRSFEPSPLHPHHQAKLSHKSSAVSSPSWERKGASENSHGPPLTPGRSRLRSVTRGDDSPDDSPSVPKFGDWDDNDPASGEGFSVIFERVREEKHSGGGRVPAMANESSSYANGQNRYQNDSPKGCSCFPWGKK